MERILFLVVVPCSGVSGARQILALDAVDGVDDLAALHPPRQRRVGRQALPRVRVGHGQVLREAGENVLLRRNRNVEIIKTVFYLILNESICFYRTVHTSQEGANHPTLGLFTLANLMRSCIPAFQGTKTSSSRPGSGQP